MASLMPPNGSVDSTILNENSFSNFSIQFTNLNSVALMIAKTAII